MANRFWVGSGTWDTTSTSNWSATSGGATGASVPGAADVAVFDVNSGTCSVVTTGVSVGGINITNAFAGTLQSTSIGITAVITITSTTITILSTASTVIRDITFSATATTGTPTVNVNVASAGSLSNTSLNLGEGVSSTATFTYTTNASYFRTAVPSERIRINLYSGTLSCGTVNSNVYDLYVYGGTFSPVATTVTIGTGGALYVRPITSATAALGTSTISAPTGSIELGNSDGSGTTTITVGATQTLSANIIAIYPTVAGAVTLRTITATGSFCSILVKLKSGVNLTAGAITCPGQFDAIAFSGYSTLPTLTLTSITGNSADSVTVNIDEVGFTCGAISLTTTGGVFLDYSESSKGAVSITGTITLTDTNLTTAFGPRITLQTQPAFSGTPTAVYAALNASVRGTITFRNSRAVTATTITTGRIDSSGGATENVTLGAVTLGGTLSTVIYPGTLYYGADSGSTPTFTASSIAKGTGATVDIYFSGPENINITGTVACDEIWVQDSTSANTGTVTFGGALTVTNTGIGTGSSYFKYKGALSFTSITVSGAGMSVNDALRLGDAFSTVGSITISGTLTTGSAATNRGAVVLGSTGTINFTNTTATHSVSVLSVEAIGSGGLIFASGSTLALNYNASAFTLSYPLYITSTTATVVTLRTVTCDYSVANTNSGEFYIDTPLAAVTFSSSPTVGATGLKLGFKVQNCASFSCPALAVDAYAVYATGAVTQSGAITLPAATPATAYAALCGISFGAPSTISSIVCSALTDTVGVYAIDINGTSTVSIGAITGPTVATTNVDCNVIATTATFTGAISGIRALLTSANVVLTGALNVTVNYSIDFTPGFTLTANTSSIVLTGLWDGSSYLGHGGYTLYSVTFQAAPKQFIYYEYASNLSGGDLTLTNLSCNGSSNPQSFLRLSTNVTVTGNTASVKLTLTPNSILNRFTVCSDVVGVPRTLSAGNQRSISTGIDFRDITAANTTPWGLSGISSGDAGGNSNITFTTPVTRYLVSTTAVNWNTTAAWSATPGGASGASVPLAQDLVDLSTGATTNVNTNNVRHLGRVNFNGFGGILTITGTAYTLASLDFSGFLGSMVSGANAGLVMLTRSAAVFTPYSSTVTVPISVISLSTLTIPSGTTNVYAIGNYPFTISGFPFSTNTGTSIVNFTGDSTSSFIFGMQSDSRIIDVDESALGNAALSAVNLNSSTVNSASSIVYRGNVVTTTHNATATDIYFFGSFTATNSTFAATSVYSYATIALGTSTITTSSAYLNSGTWNGQNETLIASSDISITGGVTFNSDNETFKLQPIVATTVTFTSFNSSLLNKLVVDDISSTSTNLQVITLNSNCNVISSGGIKQFDSSAMRRPLRFRTIGAANRFKVRGGLNSVFSNKAWSYFSDVRFDVTGTEPLYIPYAFLRNCNELGSNAVVAYGPANLGLNTGNFVFPSMLRYYAFVDTGPTSFTIPPEYNGMGAFLVVGGGATPSSVYAVAGKGGGGGGGTSYYFAYPPNNATQPLLSGQTAYVNAGAYAVAPVANAVGGNGNLSWANILSNSQPISANQGAIANGGNTATGTTGGTGGSVSSIASLSISGNQGGTAGTGLSGGGGGASSTFEGGDTLGADGGGGGGGIASTGFLSTGSDGGNGGAGSVSGGLGGIGGTSPTAGAAGASSTGAGGGGGGANTTSTTLTGAVVLFVTRTGGSNVTQLVTASPHGLSTNSVIRASTTNYLKTGTYSRTSPSSTVTVSITNHGLSLGESFYFDSTSGSVADGSYTVSNVVNANQFQFVSTATTSTSGNCRLGQFDTTLRSYIVNVIDSFTFTLNTTATSNLSSGTLVITYIQTAVAAPNGADGGSGALNSAQQFIRYYNNVYTPGFFGIGAGGGGGGTTTSTLGVGGSGGDGGIGSGGGGIGALNSISLYPLDAIFKSGRGGPGLVMFIYAIKSNNQIALQGL